MSDSRHRGSDGGDGRSVSLWMAEQEPRVPTSFDAGRERVDLCVVGAGIAGLSTAYEAALHGASVVVLEDRSIGGGQTRRTTAHLSSAMDDRFTEIERIHGVEGARVAAESHASAIDRIEQIVNEERIDCGFDRLDGFLCLAGDRSEAWLETELAASRRAGLNGVELLDGCPGVPGLSAACLRFPRQAQLHPMRYLHGLAEAAERRGVRIRGGRVQQIEPGRDGCVRVSTTDGGRVEARHVVVATNSPIHERVAVHTKQAAYRTYVTCFAVARGAVPKALYWDTLDPYHYVRLHESTGAHDVLIVGGEDHRIAPMDADDAEERYADLERWARAYFPAIERVVQRWSGQVLETIDGLGFIGATPGGPSNVFLVTGDSGMGMTHGALAGILLADLVRGHDHPWASVYDPSRKPLRAASTFLRENLEATLGYTDWLRPGEGDTGSLQRDSGGVFGWGPRKRAVYRDPDGRLHVRSPVCPHLGGIVGWNDAEKTWDCPCHGSRFDPYGRVVQGPANASLAASGLTESGLTESEVDAAKDA